MLGWALRLTSYDEEQAEDLVHDAFVHFSTARPDLNAILPNLEGYLCTMLRNLNLSNIRRATRLRARVVPLSNLSLAEFESLEAGLRAARLRPLLNAFPLPNGPAFNNLFEEFSASYSDPSSLDAASIRLDHAATQKLQLFGRYNRAPSRTEQRGNARAGGFGSQSLNTLSRTFFDTETLTFGASYTFTPRLANDLRFNLSRARGSTSTRLDDFGGATPPPAASFLLPETFSTAMGEVEMLFRGGATASFAAGRGVDNLQRQLSVNDVFYEKGS